MKALVADDEAVSRHLLESSLRRWGYDPVVARDGIEASQILLSPDAPKLAVLDWLMPGIDGAQLCQEIRRKKPEPYTYIIMLTSKRDHADVVTGLEAGADDYVMKPFEPAELKVRLRTGKRIVYLQDQLINAREALRHRATRDQLTGLWNRAAILETLEEEVSRTRREGGMLGVVLVDLDYFKQVNDSHGHAVGDEVLCAAAHAMQDCTRHYDSIGRYGGEEFLVVLPGCDHWNVISHAERIRAAVASVVVETQGGAAIHPTASLGAAVWCGSMCDASDLIHATDTALYRAKERGRNCVAFGENNPVVMPPTELVKMR